MKFKSKQRLLGYNNSNIDLPRSQKERLEWIKKRVENGYYESKKVRIAVADAFIDPSTVRRARGS
ncbi:MAG: hypothetical protein CME10_11315 [Gemmatimonadetes bacterium]|nr:hypothetical protein [Gemmatimonadota bacterium]